MNAQEFANKKIGDVPEISFLTSYPTAEGGQKLMSSPPSKASGDIGVKMGVQKARSPPAVFTRSMNRDLAISRTEQKLQIDDFIRSITVIDPTCENDIDDSPSLDQRLNVKGLVKRGKGFNPGLRSVKNN